MQEPSLPSVAEWGYEADAISPHDLVTAFERESLVAVASFDALPEGPEACGDKPGYARVSVLIPLSMPLYDQLMNGQTGYRAHYAGGTVLGERLNRNLVEAIVEAIIESKHLYEDRFSHVFCGQSLRGPFTKLWYAKQLTDPSANEHLKGLAEVIRLPRWRQYWNDCARPRKGRLAPVPDETSVLINGSFVDELGNVYEQKPGRSTQLFESGWT